MQWVVSASDEGLKLVTFLKNKLGNNHSARQIKNGIESNLCRVNQKLEHFASTILKRGDVVSFETELFTTQTKKIFSFSKDDIVYENLELLVYNKPAGYASDGEEITHALKTYGRGWELLHRLDRDTTGLLMFTKGTLFRQKMVTAFKMHEVEKVYLALVDGIPKQSSGIIDNYLGKIREYEGQTLWGSIHSHQGHHAITRWALEKHGPQASLLRCFPETGRTHQIRVHLSEMGHPILGDKQYGRSIHCNYPASRCLLHASELSFIHPTTQQKVHFQAPLADDFKKALDQLMKGSP